LWLFAGKDRGLRWKAPLDQALIDAVWAQTAAAGGHIPVGFHQLVNKVKGVLNPSRDDSSLISTRISFWFRNCHRSHSLPSANARMLDGDRRSQVQSRMARPKARVWISGKWKLLCPEN
jgi:hypothetical protein